MLRIRRSLNWGHVTFDQNTRENIGALLKDSTARFIHWRGFIEREEARRCLGATPVKLKISMYSLADSDRWSTVAEDQYLQRCLVAGAHSWPIVYGVTVNGLPRIVGDFHCSARTAFPSPSLEVIS